MRHHMPQLSCKAVFNEKVAIAPGRVPQAQAEDVTKNPRRNVEDRTEERRIGTKVKATVKQLVAEELAIVIEELLDDIPSPSYRNAGSGISLIV